MDRSINAIRYRAASPPAPRHKRGVGASEKSLWGDFNVARDEKDVARLEAWAGTVLFHHETRSAMEHLLAWGLVDVFRQHHPEGGLYSWWDYRMLAFPKNDGLRLDYLLATEPLAARCTAAEIDREQRKGEKPSDHAPVVTLFA